METRKLLASREALRKTESYRSRWLSLSCWRSTVRKSVVDEGCWQTSSWSSRASLPRSSPGALSVFEWAHK